MSVTREMLAAYADGELTPDQRAQVEAALAGDAALATELARHRALRDRLAAHFAPVAEEPVPDRLTAMLKSGGVEVVDLAVARQDRKVHKVLATPRWWMGSAIAASLAIGIIVGGQMFGGGSVRDDGGRLMASGALERELQNGLSSARSQDGAARILLSYKARDGRYCRVYSEQGAAGIACRDADGWAIERMQAGVSDQSTQYRQAGSAEAEIMAAAQDMAADGPLDPETEKSAQARGWKRQ